jgi:hypothetical protein
MVQRVIYDPNGFRNVEKDGEVIGYCFGYKAQYYRGFSPSIVRGVKICVDGEEAPQDAILFTNKGETFTLNELTTVVDADMRWEYGEYACFTVLKEGGLAAGKHHIDTEITICSSYMPFPNVAVTGTDFEI